MMETITKKLGTKPNISNDELESLADILGIQFVLRRDLFAQQRDDGRYVCIRRPLHHEHLVDHLLSSVFDHTKEQRRLVGRAAESDWFAAGIADAEFG